MNLTQNYRWNENVEAIEMEGQWILLHAEHNTITKLNETGGFIWSLLQQGEDVKQVIDAVTSRFDVNRNQAQMDVESFLSELKQVDAIVSKD